MKVYETVGCVFLVELSKTHYGCPDEKSSFEKYRIFNCLRNLGVEFSFFIGCFFEEGSQNVIYVPKIVFGRDIIFDRNGYTWFLSLIERIFDFCNVLKTAFHVSTGFFWGKQSFNMTHKTYFFSDIEQETFQNLVNFFRRSFKIQSLPAGELLEEKTTIE